MKTTIKLLCVTAVTLFSFSCTMGDKGDEGRTDTTKVDTSASTTTTTTGGSTGTGVGDDPAVNTGKGSTMQTDTVKADSAKKNTP
jgi:hypothetical protein